MSSESTVFRRILGIWDGHDAGAALVEDGRVVAAVSEERFTRIKRQGGFPVHSVAEVLRLGGCGVSDIEGIAVAGQQGRLPARVFDMSYQRMDPGQVDPLSSASRAYAGYQNHIAGLPVIRRLEDWGSQFMLSRRLAHLGFQNAHLQLIDHHIAHAATAIAALETSARPALVVTMDGYGDGRSVTVWRYDTEGAHLLYAAGANASFALLYGALTRQLGFREGEEGKLTGLSARATGQRNLNLRPFLSQEKGALQLDRTRAFATLKRAHDDGVAEADLAHALQSSLEEAVVAFIKVYLRRTGLRNLAVSGGLFANVALNGRLAALDLASFAVAPAMTDQGLCVGAALQMAGQTHASPMPHIRLGSPIDGNEVDPAQIAQLLANGDVIGVARGAMEFGPRALGCRSILFDPRNPALAKRLGERLKRESFMPFGPILCDQDYNSMFDIPRARIDRSSREMTLAIPVSSEMQELAPSAIHVDGTARPQVVDENEDPWLHEVLTHFRGLTRCPMLVNTSFNRHREPIVRSGREALDSALAIGLDAVVIGGELQRFDQPASGHQAQGAHL